MRIGTILAPIAGIDGDRASLGTAVELARRWSSHLIALHVRLDPRSYMPIAGEGLSTGMIQKVIATAEADALRQSKAAEAAFEAATAGIERADRPHKTRKPSVQYVVDTGVETERVATRGRLADLIVLPQPSGEGPISAQVTFEAALFETGRPVLLVPAKPPHVIGERVAIAWNGSKEAARALAVAEPFLASAKSATVLTVRGKGERAAEPSDLVEALEWRGIDAKAKAVDAGAAGAGPALLEAAKQAGADLLIMGAYGHSRLREFILGGATREAIARAPLPVLMAH